MGRRWQPVSASDCPRRASRSLKTLITSSPSTNPDRGKAAHRLPALTPQGLAVFRTDAHHHPTRSKPWRQAGLVGCRRRFRTRSATRTVGSNGPSSARPVRNGLQIARGWKTRPRQRVDHHSGHHNNHDRDDPGGRRPHPRRLRQHQPSVTPGRLVGLGDQTLANTCSSCTSTTGLELRPTDYELA